MGSYTLLEEVDEAELELIKAHQPPTQDRWYLTYGVFWVLGTCTLFPWNVLITETAYFNLRFHTPPYPHLIADNFENTMAVSFQLPNLLVLVAFAIWKLEHKIRPSYLVVLPLVGIFVLMAVQVALTQMSWVSGGMMLWVTLTSAVALGSFTSVLNAGGWALISCLPPVYAQGFMTGQAVAGLAVAMASFVTTAMQEPQGHKSLAGMKNGAFLYFLTSLFDIALGIAGYALLGFITFFRHYQTKQAYEATHPLDCNPSANQTGSDDPEAAAPEGLTEPLLEASPQTKLGYADTHICGIRYYRAAVALNFAITLSLFPGITSMIHSVDPDHKSSRLTSDLFVPIGYVLFNAGDLGGRLAAGVWPKKAPCPRMVMLAAILRLVFIPLLLLCYIVPPGEKLWYVPVIFAHDSLPHSFILLMGLTNGMLGSVCMMHAGSFVDIAEQKSEGTRMALSLIVGCTSGCFISMFALIFSDL